MTDRRDRWIWVVVACWCLALAACDTQFADPVWGAAGGLAGVGGLSGAGANSASGGGSGADPCRQWTSADSCAADHAHGCSYQPNPVGCDASQCAAASCQTGDPFVRRSGRELWLHDEPFRFLGANSWGIAWGSSCQLSGFSDQDAGIKQAFLDLAAMHVSVLRIWAFQSYAGSSGSDYSSFDKIVNAARRAGVRLIFVLENNWGDCTKGGQRSDDWFRSGFASAYGGYALSYTDYVRGLVQHFRDEPDVLAWELIHEAGANDFSALDTFIAQASTLIRDNDPNHLIAAGINNGSTDASNNAGNPSNYQLLHTHPSVDLLDVHDFSSPDTPFTEGEFQDQAIAVSLDKPIFVGALAVSLKDTSASAFSQRGNQVGAKLDAAFANGFVGALIYDYNPNWGQAGTSFDARPEEPLAGPTGVLATRARSILGQ